MTLAFSAPGIGLVAADTRYTFAKIGPRDFGQRIRRVDGGWVAATGNVAVALLALREAEAIGLSDLDAVQAMVPEVHRYCDEHTDCGIAASMILMARESDGGFSLHGVLSSDGLTVERPHTGSGRVSCIIA